MEIRAHVLSTNPEGGGTLELVSPMPGKIIKVGPREAACLIEWSEFQDWRVAGEPFEIPDEVARREGLLVD